MIKLEISLKRVQSFIFDVPRLKAMLGANALISQTMRHELCELIGDNGMALPWPAHIKDDGLPEDPLSGTSDPDNPAALYNKGILTRDGGHFIAVFEDEEKALSFRHIAEQKLAEMLPGVLYEIKIEPFDETTPGSKQKPEPPNELHLLDLPVLQVCQETGRQPASGKGTKVDWEAASVTSRFRARQRKTSDIIGIMYDELYPSTMRWDEADDLDKLADGDYIALIHADGNGIGRRYNEWKKQAPANDTIFSEARGEAFYHSMRVVARRALVDALATTFTARGGVRPYEVLMLGGDDLLLICRAGKALDLALAYSNELKKYILADGKRLDVAIGVAIAQKSYPLHRLHDLAESLASSAKRLYRSLPENERSSVIDWQVVTQSWFEGVAEARQQSERITYTVGDLTEALLLTGRPYCVLGNDGLEGLTAAVDKLAGDGKATRTPLRSLRVACERGRLAGEMAFGGLPEDVQSIVGWKQKKRNKLWKRYEVDDKTFYQTRTLDIIGIREIAHLGSKTDD